MNPIMEEKNDIIQERRAEELEALRAYYGDDLLPGSSSPAARGGAPIPIDGPWFLRLRRRPRGEYARGSKDDVVVVVRPMTMEPMLEIRLSSSYPIGNDPPVPTLHNVMMDPSSMRELLSDMIDMYECGLDVGIVWGEMCMEVMDRGGMTPAFDDGGGGGVVGVVECDEGGRRSSSSSAVVGGGDDSDDGETATRTKTHDEDVVVVDGTGRTTTFVSPNGTRYGQPARRFPSDVISSDSMYSIRGDDVTRTPPFRPPKSGPSELILATVCAVTRIEHVQWAMANLIYYDKRMSGASHNMFAYRFLANANDGVDGSRIVSDNDDDGERGAGNKLSSLLEACRAENVLVVVSRWFGGVHLGPARFKWIASVARDGLERGGFVGR